MQIAINGLTLILCLWFCYTDLKERRISNALTYPAVIILLLLRLLEPDFYFGLIPAGVLFFCWLINPRWAGEGDIKLVAVIGLAFGLYPTLTVLFWMGAAATVFIILYQLFARKKIISVPLAPFITIGAVITLLPF